MNKEKKIGEWKKLMADQLTEKMKVSGNFFIADYVGLASEEINEFRRELESTSAKYMVVKNSIAKIAFDNAGLGDLVKYVEGGTGIVLSGNDPAATAKTVSKFSEAHKALKIRAGYLDGIVIDAVKINYLASLPSREELIAKVVYGIKSPISGFVSILGNTVKSLLYVIRAIKEKRGTA